ncbi:MAG: hypothetical protein Q8891_05885 [Bacteroidota bacterium]|nr:hypothetical protein [Bacteroidota bacterium]
MNKQNDISDEIKSISPLLASIEKINVFSIPENYFNGLSERISVYTFLNVNDKTDFNKNNAGRVPDGYFNTLSDNILAKIKNSEPESAIEELQKLSPFLVSLKNINVFTVPPGYFENINDTLINKLQNHPAKIVSINKVKTWWKYLAAAVITGAIAISSLQIFNSSPDMQKNNTVVTESSGLSDYIQSSMQYKTPEQVDKGIASLSDNEIMKYLEKHGNIMDDATLANEIDTKELPAATDYLTNDNALDNYLNSIDDQSINKKTP